MVESQGRGSLHLHMMVWSHGFMDPKTYKLKLQDDNFIKRVIKYVDTIIKCDFDDF